MTRVVAPVKMATIQPVLSGCCCPSIDDRPLSSPGRFGHRPCMSLTCVMMITHPCDQADTSWLLCAYHSETLWVLGVIRMKSCMADCFPGFLVSECVFRVTLPAADLAFALGDV